jgi:hypothetical protein
VITLRDLSEDTQCELEEETVFKKIVSPANLQTVLKPYFGLLANTEAKHISKCGQKVTYANYLEE